MRPFHEWWSEETDRLAEVCNAPEKEEEPSRPETIEEAAWRWYSSVAKKEEDDINDWGI
jgi:hypothetical protein